MKNYTSTCLIELTKEEINILIELSNKVTQDPSKNPEFFCKEIKKLSLQIPNRLQQILYGFSKYGSETGFLLIKGFPIDNVFIPRLDTPLNQYLNLGEKTILARIQGLLITCLGEMVAYEGEGCGRLFQDIVPVKNMADKQTSSGNSKELEIHTEQAFSKLRPDILSLSCLRGNEYAETYILPVQTIINNLTYDDLQLLEKPLWNIGIDYSFKINGTEFIDGDLRGPLPILERINDYVKLVFDQDLMQGTTLESCKMIENIIDIYNKKKIKHNLQPGEIIFIHNNNALHGRSPFSANYDGTDRFLVRCFCLFNENYEKSVNARTGRVIKAIYS